MEDHINMNVTLEEIAIDNIEPLEIDLDHLIEITSHSDKGSSQMSYLVKHWEYKQANAVRLLREELDYLCKQREEMKLKRLEILEEHRFEEEHTTTTAASDRDPVMVPEELYNLCKVVPKKDNEDVSVDSTNQDHLQIDAELDTVVYWKQRAITFEKLLDKSTQREQILSERLEESIKNMEKQSTPVKELSQMLKRADNFIHFILQNAPIVLGHMDKELRYHFNYNHYPSFKEEDIIGDADTEIFSGAGVKESLNFKREVLERGLAGKRETTFDTEPSGSKTFLLYVAPVFNITGETIGVNYIGMDITDQVRKREKMAKLREKIAVQKAMETELNKTIHITEETMRAKQLLATMSHEIRSPLTGVVGMAGLLSQSKLEKEQRQLLNVMISAGDLVLQLINDILDLSKVESGVMKLEATKFRPREVVRHVLQTAAASFRKMLTLEGDIAENIPIEVIGDVLRIRQILTNLVSNAIKFTHEGKVGIRLFVIPAPYAEDGDHKSDDHCGSEEMNNSEECYVEDPCGDHKSFDEPRTPVKGRESMSKDEDRHASLTPTTVWIQCDVYDTGIGIPEHALPTLFKKYMQASDDHARKYGGTGLGLAICKQLVELMGGHMTVSSKEHCGSTFTFVLPYRVSPISDDQSDDPDELPDAAADHDTEADDITAGYFQFQPGTLGTLSSLFNSSGSSRDQSLLSNEESGQVQRPAVQMANTSEPQQADELQISNTDARLQSFASSRPEATRHEEEKPKILLVEDNKINVMVTMPMMKQLGHTIDVANNGVEALRAVQSRSYDLILMDVHMPVMNGLEATRIIRSYEKTGNWDSAAEAGIELPTNLLHPLLNSPDSSSRKIPIVAITANALSESAEECYANGMDSFISKPITPQKLKECLQQYLPT